MEELIWFGLGMGVLIGVMIGWTFSKWYRCVKCLEVFFPHGANLHCIRCGTKAHSNKNIKQ